eukprot:scaffold1954_cov364-Prasinococcus_capsulatus_cf.AAC.5
MHTIAAETGVMAGGTSPARAERLLSRDRSRINNTDSLSLGPMGLHKVHHGNTAIFAEWKG